MKKIIILLLILFSGFLLVGCDKPAGPDEVVKISIDEKFLSEKVEITQVFRFINNLGVTIHYGDESTELISFKKEMLSEEDYISLFTEGVHTVTVKYLEFETEFTIEVYKKVEEFYKVTVVYPDGTNVGAEVVVKWIRNLDFARTTSTDENGQSIITMDETEYTIQLNNLPEGYIYNPNIYSVNKDNKEIEIKLISISECIEGTGSKNDPFAIDEGTYEVVVANVAIQGMVVYSFMATESAVYTIESLAMSKYSDNAVDPYLGFFGEEMDFGSVDYTGNQESYVNINFKYQFNAEKGKTYYFFVFASMAMEFPAKFYFTVSK